MTWEELVADVTARHPLHESQMFGMPCLEQLRELRAQGTEPDGAFFESHDIFGA